MKEISRNQSGAILVTFAILLVALLGFAALATEAGRWYLVRSELSKAVDAAAMAGAKNISNPFVTVGTIANEVGNENFPAGQLGTPGTGQGGSVSFTTTSLQSNKIQVVGNVSAIAILARLFGIGLVPVSSSGVAQKNKVEIMMVLDRSGSMAGQPIVDLRAAATSFLGFFKETEDQDKMGLITFATGVSVDYPLSTNFITRGMLTQIDNIQPQTCERMYTNAEDAINQAGGPGGFTDQTGVPGDERVKQYLIFFTDGNPDAFRGNFTYDGTVYDAVVYTDGANGSCTGTICAAAYIGGYGSCPANHYGYLCDPITGASIGVPPLPTGDGKPADISNCSVLNTQWQAFSDYPPPAPYGPESCSIPEDSLRSTNPSSPNWFRNVARQKATKNAQKLQDKYVKIYVIGLGNVDGNFLDQIASPGLYYPAPTSDQLEAIFNAIAKEIKLRLVS